MIRLLSLLQEMFGPLYPLLASAGFAGLAAYFAVVYDSPDKFALVMLSVAASGGWFFMHSVEVILFEVLEKLDGVKEKLADLISDRNAD